MSAPVKPIPDNFPVLCAYLTVRDAAAAIDFYQAVFGAEEILRLVEPSGKVAHAELRIGGAVLMLADEYPGFNRPPEALGGTPVALHLYVPDADAVMAQAVQAGAKPLVPVEDQFYGDRSGRFEDPFGHVWLIATHIEDVSPEEMQRRFETMLASIG
jgi:PhnB protein